MKEKLKKFNILRNIFKIVSIVGISFFGFYVLIKIFGIEILDLEFSNFISILLRFCIVFLTVFSLLYYLSIIWHEMGHLVLGLRAKMKFVSFNVLNYSFYLENNKLKIKKEANLPGRLGYCSMSIDTDKKYEVNSIILYFLGGILFHFIAATITAILMIFIKNLYLDYVCMLNIIVNLFVALYNAFPVVSKSGFNTDALQIMHYVNDKEYINTVSKLQELQRLLINGVALKDIDPKLFSKPQSFNTNSDVLNAIIYVDYLSSKDEYLEAREYIDKILEEGKEFLSNQDMMTIKLQLINCIFYTSDDLSEIKEIWNDDLKRYLDMMSSIIPTYIGFNYMYAALVEKDEVSAIRYLEQFELLDKSRFDKYLIDDTIDFIRDINEKINKIFKL